MVDLEDFVVTEAFMSRSVFDGKVKNIKGMLDRLSTIFDVSDYYQKLDTISNEAKKNPDYGYKLPYEEMQTIFEDGIFRKYADQLDDLNDELSSYTDFYELHVLNKTINNDISVVSCENIANIISNTKKLIKIITELNTLDDERKINIINESYKTIYSVLLHERIFDRNDTFELINKTNSTAIRENIGRLLYNDIGSLTEKELMEEDLKTIKTKGLEYDYLSDNVLEIISRKKVGEKNSEYQKRKEKALNNLIESIEKIETIKQTENEDIKKSRLTIIKNDLILASMLLASIPPIAIPVVFFKGGKKIGYEKSQKITEYGIVTRTVNPITNEIIKAPRVEYSEDTTQYSATILLYSPWKKSPSGIGYVSEVTSYEYISNNEEENSFDINKIKDAKMKYIYNTSKEKLDTYDSTSDYTILITETYRDDSLNRPSNKYTVLFTVIGTLIGVAIDAIMALLVFYSLDTIKAYIDKLMQEVKSNKKTIEQAKKELIELKNKVNEIDKEKNELKSKYGISSKDIKLRLKQ